MTKPIKVLSIFGTRPEAVKMAPLVKALEAEEGFESVVCVTAQHREMLDAVLELFDITPDEDLNIMKHGQSITDITVRVLEGLQEILQKSSRTMCWFMEIPPQPLQPLWRLFIRRFQLAMWKLV